MSELKPTSHDRIALFTAETFLEKSKQECRDLRVKLNKAWTAAIQSRKAPEKAVASCETILQVLGEEASKVPPKQDIELNELKIDLEDVTRKLEAAVKEADHWKAAFRDRLLTVHDLIDERDTIHRMHSGLVERYNALLSLAQLGSLNDIREGTDNLPKEHPKAIYPEEDSIALRKLLLGNKEPTAEVSDPSPAPEMTNAELERKLELLRTEFDDFKANMAFSFESLKSDVYLNSGMSNY